MRLVKLTQVDTCRYLYINPEMVSCLWETQEGHVGIDVVDVPHTLFVIEPIRDVLFQFQGNGQPAQ